MAIDHIKRINLARWNELVPVHMASNFYKVSDFRRGRCTLNAIELHELGDVKGLNILHLQCHFGLDTLSLARMGANVTGVDFSPVAIDAAKRLAQELDIKAQFLCCDVYDVDQHTKELFDVIFASYGVLIWLDDLYSWARVVASLLRKGGYLYVVDEHPFALSFQANRNIESLQFMNTYLKSSAPTSTVIAGSYADRTAAITNNTAFLWLHSVSHILNSIIDSGLRISFFHEFPYSVYEMFPGMVRDEKGKWHLEGGKNFPYLFSVKATKLA